MSNLDTVPCGYFSFSDNGVLRNVNATFCLQLDTSKEALIGKHVESVLTLASRIFFQTHFFPLLKMQGHAEEIFMTLQKANRTQLPVLLSASKRSVDGEALYECVFITVHNRKKFEDELVAARHQAEKALHANEALLKIKSELQEHAEKLDEQLARIHIQNKELQQMNRVITHELQEPLRKISVFAKMLTDTHMPEADFQKALERLSRSARQMRTIVSGLQQYVWLQEASLTLEEVDLNVVLLQSIKQLEQEFQASQFSITVEKLPLIKADATQVQLLFYHVLTNAIKFRKENEASKVIITATLLERNSFREVTNKYKFEPFVKIDITDNGVGFDPVYKDKVWELFGRLQNTEGRGLGLALCKRVVDNHAGFISIDSRPGTGTHITIYLPVAH